MNKKRTMKCPRCGATCIESPRSTSNICVADYTGDNKFFRLTNNERQIRIWGYMKPPRISEPIPSVSPERLEMVRSMLDESTHEKPSRINVESSINLHISPDGTFRKTTSRTERKVYPSINGNLMRSEALKILDKHL